MVLAKSPIIESGPYLLKILTIKARVLFPETLLRKHIGIMSLVKSNFVKYGVKNENISLMILLLTRILTEKIIATKLGIILKVVIIPSLAPIRNSS